MRTVYFGHTFKVEVAVIVGQALAQVNVGVNGLALNVEEAGAEDGLVALELEADILSGISEAWFFVTCVSEICCFVSWKGIMG